MRLWQGFLVLFFSFFFFLVFGFLFPSESVHLNCLLQVFCFLGSTSCWTCSSSSSSPSSCLDRRLRLLWFRSARSRSLWVSFSVLPSFSSTMRIAWVVCLGLGLHHHYHLHHVLLHESCCSTVTSCSSSSCCTHPLCSRLGPCCPVPCAADLCLLAQQTWRSSSRCAGVLSWSWAAPKCRAGWPQVALPWRNESWSPVGPISTAQYNSTQ